VGRHAGLMPCKMRYAPLCQVGFRKPALPLGVACNTQAARWPPKSPVSCSHVGATTASSPNVIDTIG
jgi:hypothetical protein